MRALIIATLAFGCLSTFADDEKGTKAKDATAEEKVVKTTEVKIVPQFASPPLVLKVPETWTKKANSNSMRLATYETPKAEGDDDSGELTVFSFRGGGGSVAGNLSRWKDQFKSEGRKIAVKKGTAGESKNDYYIVEVSGTFMKSIGPPIAGRKEAKPDSRMLGVILMVKEDGSDEASGVYFLKLVGPKASIAAQAKQFRKSFGGNAAKETPYEL